MNAGKLKVAVLILLGITLIVYITVGEININGALLSGGEETVFTETDNVINYDAFMNPSFYTYENAGGYFYATKDGIKFITNAGEVKMSEMYSMSAPLLMGAGDIVAVAEHRGNTVYVYDDEQLLYINQMKNPILSFSVNARGQSSVITQSGDDYNIEVFTQNGDLIHGNLHPANNVFPVMSAISNDGQIFAVLYYDITGVSISSHFKFFYLDKSKSIDYDNYMFGANDEYNDEVVHTFKFMDNNKIIVVSDKTISCIDPDTRCQKIWSMTLNNRLDAVSFNDTNTFAVAYGEGLVNKPAEEPGLVEIFQTDMTSSAEFMSDGRVTYLYAGRSAVIIGVGREFTAVSNKGEVLWGLNSTSDVRQMLFLDGVNTILAAGEKRAVIYRGAKQRIAIPDESQDPEVSLQTQKP